MNTSCCSRCRAILPSLVSLNFVRANIKKFRIYWILGCCMKFTAKRTKQCTSAADLTPTCNLLKPSTVFLSDLFKKKKPAKNFNSVFRSAGKQELKPLFPSSSLFVTALLKFVLLFKKKELFLHSLASKIATGKKSLVPRAERNASANDDWSLA